MYFILAETASIVRALDLWYLFNGVVDQMAVGIRPRINRETNIWS